MCGILGVVATSPVNQLLYDGLQVLQHRGQDAAGIATSEAGRFHMHKGSGLVRDVFRTRNMRDLQGNWGIGHVRYPTAGSAYNAAEAQPFYVNSPFGLLLAHNGNLTNSEALKREMFLSDLRHINTSSDSEVLLNVLAHELQAACKGLKLDEDAIFRAVAGVHRRCRGAYAVVVMIAGYGLLAFRDPYGIRPLVIGRNDTAAGTEWLVASDGARSGIRSMLDLKLEGASYEGRFVIADIRIDLPLPTERLAFFDPEWNRGNTVLLHREPLGIWRVDYQLPEGETPEQALSPESLKTRINAQLAMIGHADKPWEMDWSSVYSARTLTLPDYLVGRTLFMGDAAHLLPIFGVRGANTGFQDAQALAWRLGLVCRGQASSALLANYSAERVGAAREIIDEAGKSTRFMTPPTRGFRLLRDAVLSLSLSQEFVRPLYHWRTSRPHEYTHSMLNSTGDDNGLFKSGPAHGAPPQNVRLGANDFLLDHLGGGFDLLYFTDEAALPDALQKVIATARAKGMPLNVIAVGAAQPVAGADKHLPDADGHLRQRYGVPANGGAYLLRPDQHVCARWLTLDATRLQAALTTALPQ